MVRLTAQFWVQAYIRRLSLENIPAFVVHHGDDTAGAVLIKLATLDGQAQLFQRRFDLLTGGRTWDKVSVGNEPEVDQYIAKERNFDNDLWLIEVEDRGGRHFLDQPGFQDG